MRTTSAAVTARRPRIRAALPGLLIRTRAALPALLAVALLAGALDPRERSLAAQPGQERPTPAAAGTAAKRAAVAIRKPSPVAPIEAAGTGLTPQVSVRLSVDERGRVVKIEVKSFQPSTSYDAFYDREVRKALSQWRFAPAIENGVAVPAVLEWKIRFEPKETSSLPVETIVPLDSWRGIPGFVADEEGRAWVRYVASLSGEAKRKVLADLRRTADKHLTGDRTTEARKGSFVVVTDASETAAQAIAQNLDAATGVLHRMFARAILPQVAEEPVYVYAFGSQSSFRALRAELGAGDLAMGFYQSPGLITFDLEHATSNEVVEMILHEAVHAYLDRFVVRMGVEIPLWLNEGLAEYLRNSDLKDGKIEPGGHRQRSVTYRNPMASWRGPSASYLGAAEVKKAIVAGRAIPLAELVAAERNVFYGDQYRIHYSQSWMLVHFLVQGEPVWAEQQFPRFLLLVAEGFPAPASFKEAYGREPAAMEDAFRTYVRKF